MDLRLYEWEIGYGRAAKRVRRVFVIGNYSQSFDAFASLVAQIKHDFPAATDKDIELGVITDSDTIKGYTLAAWRVPENTTVPPVYSHHDGSPDFSW